MAHDNYIYQGDIYKLSAARKLFIGSKSDSWKPKYVIVYIKDNLPILELHKKKPKASKKSDKTLTDTYSLPAFKVEKLKNAKGRSFVCEITCPNIHLFLSADDEKQLDVLVFLLQTQLRLKNEIRDDIIRVVPENSECQKKIGAKGNYCLLHISPWGLTLVLERSRCLLAQWPLKSIRYYEASGGGHFTIEAGRVAPMGEGVFGFQTLIGDDDTAYDKVDSYIVNTLDRVKPSQRGTREEIEDYIREHDHLHALTIVQTTSVSQRDIQKALKLCWNMGNSTEKFSDAVLEQRGAGGSSAESSVRNSASSTLTSSLNVTLERVNMSDSSSSRSEYSPVSSRRSSVQTESRSPHSRPPLPAKFNNGGVPRRSRRREHSIPRKIDIVEVDTYGSSPRLAHPDRDQLSDGELRGSDQLQRPASPTTPRRHSNPSNVIHSTNNTDSNFNLHPYANQHQRTEFYHLSSPNLKVRKPKSPMVTPHPNKVGRAELLLSQDQGGVRSPSTSTPPLSARSTMGAWDLSSAQVTDEDHKEAQDYLDAIAKASQEKYGGHNSMDRTWSKMRRELSGGDGQTVAPGYVNTFPPTGYVNIQKLASMEEGSCVNKRQNSQSSLEKSPAALRPNSQNREGGSSMSPPIIRHSRQRSAPVESTSSVGSVSASNQGYPVMPDGLESQDCDPDICLRKMEHKNSEAASTGETNRHTSQLSGFSAFDQVDGPVADWLISASCEDLSDHMRHVIYNEDGDENNGNGPSKDEDDENTYDEIHSDKEEKSDSNSALVSTSNEKPPLPFTGLKKFQNKVDIGGPRDRSKSFGYVNTTQVSPNPKPQSSAPSAHLIRKMMAARSKQENTLRKSLSNPNFLNLGSKEHLFNVKTVPSNIGSNSNLHANTKQKSRSFGSLFPAIKKALSRESLGHSRSTTPERRASFSLRRRSSEHEFRRQNSLHSVGEMSIRGIRMTERSRSFRRVRGAKSVELLSKREDDDDRNRISTATNISSPPSFSNQISETADETKVASENSGVTKSPASFKFEKSATLPPNFSDNSTSMSTSSKPVANSSFTSSIHVNLSQPSSNSMSPAPSPSHLPPPPLPARKPRKASAGDITSSSMSKNQNTPSMVSNYTNAPSIKTADGSSTERRESATSQSSQYSRRRVSSKGDKNTTDLASGVKSHNPNRQETSSSGSQIYATSSKTKVPRQSRRSKVGAKS